MQADPEQRDHDEAWRAALWILEALPPSTRAGATGPAGPMRARKLETLLRRVNNWAGTGRGPLAESIVPGAPFGEAVLWWAWRLLPYGTLLHRSAAKVAVGSRLLEVAGSLPATHAVLLAAARARTRSRDASFSERAIRADLVRGLQARQPDVD